MPKTEIQQQTVAYLEPSFVVEVAPRFQDGQNVVPCLDVLAVHEALSEAVEYARENGPILVESLTYRLEGHSMGDPQRYRTKEEVEEFQANGPIGRFRRHLVENYKSVSEADLDRIDEAVLEEVRALLTETEAPCTKPA